MIAVELNTAVEAHLSTLGSYYPNVELLPLSGYEDTKVPFIIYFEYPGSQNDEQFFLRVSNVIYYIYDTDISRMKDVGYQLEQFLHVGDNVQPIKSLIAPPSVDYGDLRYRITTSRLVSGSVAPPIEREGFAYKSLNFRVVYLDA